MTVLGAFQNPIRMTEREKVCNRYPLHHVLGILFDPKFRRQFHRRRPTLLASINTHSKVQNKNIPNLIGENIFFPFVIIGNEVTGGKIAKIVSLKRVK